MKVFRRAGTRVLWTWLGLAAACSNNTPPPQPPSFERPTRVAFVCVDTLQTNTQASLVSLDRCHINEGASDAGATSTTSSYVLHALVTQSSRGEVAAVNLSTHTVIDSRPDIPGPTFVPVGEVPTAIAVAEAFPHTTYVANAGSRDISVVHTSAFLKTANGEDAMAQRVRIRPDNTSAAGIPYDMVVAPDQDALFVSSAESGWLLRIPIKRCVGGVDTCDTAGQLDADHITRIPLENSWSKLPAEAFESQATVDEPYRFVCSEQPPLLTIPDQPVALPMQGTDVGAPQPAGLTVDAFCVKGACTRRLLVADRHQPIIHAIDLDALAAGDSDAAILQPILSGAPTERVAISPRVPVDLASDAETQYVYAIDARDGSVLVAQDGRVRNVSVNPTQRSDRLDLGASLATGASVALSLEVLSPHFDVLGPAAQWVEATRTPATLDDPLLCIDPDHQTRVASRLRGVFLAVGLTDGTIRIVNVHDMELNHCRSCDRTEVPNFTASLLGYDPFPVVRNRTRIGITFPATGVDQEAALVPAVTPQFEITGAAIGIKADGTTNDPRTNGLDCVTCESNQAISFPAPDELTIAVDGGVSVSGDVTVGDAGTVATSGSACSAGQGRVCSLADPFVDPLSWVGVYEGPIPGTRGGHGRFVNTDDPDNKTGSLEFVGDPDFCSAGVFGDESVKVGDQNVTVGDQLLITSTLPTAALRVEALGSDLDATQNDLCNTLVSERDLDNGAIAFQIRRAYFDRVVIEPQLIKATTKQPSADWTQVQRCFAGLALAFQVHARGSFVMQSSGNIGFQHRVVRDQATGRCTIDASKDPRHSGRAIPGVPFDNQLIAFQPSTGSEYVRLTVLRMTSLTSSSKLYLNATDIGSTTPLFGVMPVDMRYSPSNQSLYVVDITSRGLLPVPLDPMPISVALDGTIQ